MGAVSAGALKCSLDELLLDERRGLLDGQIVGGEAAADRILSVAQLVGEIVWYQRWAITEDDRALQDVLQLADVTGPRIGAQDLEGLGGQLRGLQPHALGDALQDVVGEHWDVAGSVSQWRDHNRQDVEAVEEVFTEPALSDIFH